MVVGNTGPQDWVDLRQALRLNPAQQQLGHPDLGRDHGECWSLSASARYQSISLAALAIRAPSTSPKQWFAVCGDTGYTSSVIKSFRHKGLSALYQGQTAAKVTRSHVPKLERILTALDEATGPHEMDLPGYRLHRLKGRLKGHYSVWVSGNWRVTFRFDGVDAVDVDYVDYH